MKRSELAVLLLVMVLAAGFRFYGLSWAPPGLYPDEAMNGNNALRVLETGRPAVFYPENNGREGLFINIQALSVQAFGNTPWALRAVSALFGTLTVLGTYLLTRRLFNNPGIAALAAVLMAVGFWHVNFSRIGFRAIMAPLFAVWSLYYLYTALTSHRLWHWGLAGAFMGLGMHTYIAFRIMPFVALATLLAYWFAVRKDFSDAKYRLARSQAVGGFALAVGMFLIILLPLAWYYAGHAGSFVGRAGQVSVFSADHPVTAVVVNFVRTLGMFVYEGDHNWRHNLSGEPILFWPVAALFAVGLARSIMKVGRTLRTHGHLSTVHVLLLSWFFFGLAPSFVSNEGIPHALRAILVAPAAYIFAAEGLWWLYGLMRHSYAAHDARQMCIPSYLVPGSHGHEQCYSRSRTLALFTLCVFLLAVTVHEASAYFVRWVRGPQTAAAFNQDYADIAARINALPRTTPVYVVLEAGGALVDPPGGGGGAVPMPAQTVMYLTDTWTPEKQERRNIHYVTAAQAKSRRLPRDAVIFTLR